MTKTTVRMVLILGVLAVLIVSVAGCTSSTNSSQTPSSTTSAATQHDAFLEKYLAAYKDLRYSNSSLHVQAWELDWINSTSARLQWTALVKSSNSTYNYDMTFIVFLTTQDATNYLNTMNTTAYSLASTEYPGGAYQNATGHAPQIYKDYEWNEGNPLNISEYSLHDIDQLDNIILATTAKVLS